MGMEAIVLENEVLRLPRIDQVLLAVRLMHALSEPDPRIMDAWASAGERRLEEYHAGRLLAEDGESVVQSLRKRLG